MEVQEFNISQKYEERERERERERIGEKGFHWKNYYMEWGQFYNLSFSTFTLFLFSSCNVYCLISQPY